MLCRRLYFRRISAMCANYLSTLALFPEDIVHDSSEEKLYTKTSEILFAKALDFMNMDVRVIRRAG